MYCEVKVNISTFLNNVLHEILEADPVIIQLFFLFENYFTFYSISPLYDAILHNSMKIRKINYFESAHYVTWIHSSNQVAGTV
jgi:hypothetical protein